MNRRWYIPLATLALLLGSAAAAGSASASTSAMTGPAVHKTTQPAITHGFRPGGAMIKTGGKTAAGKGAVFADQSSNWSGYAVTGGTDAFNSVSASWTEPAATCSGRAFSSFWVGLDGFNSQSVEQTGTDSDCGLGGRPKYYGWYEMFPAAPVNFTNPVSPGDSMSASVSVSGDNYTLVLTDNTQGWNQTIHQTQSGLSNSSAEVITEAPSSSSGVLPLADFGTVNYSGASANGASMGSQNPTEIIMVGNSGDKDSTSAISGGSFSNTWISSN
jgi:peptidase A4-like protein